MFTVTLEAKPNPDYTGSNDWRGYVNIKKTFVSVASLQEASKVCKDFIEESDLGGGNWTGGQVFENGSQIAHISYNGRVWEGKENAPHIGKEIKI